MTDPRRSLASVTSELMRASHLAFVETYRSMGRAAPKGGVAEFEGVTAVATGLAEPQFNRLFVIEPPGDPADILDRAGSFFGALRLPWCMIVASEVRDAVDHAARSAKMLLGTPIPLMVMPATMAWEKPPEGLEIQMVTDNGRAETFVRTMEEGFGARHGLFRIFEEPGVWSAAGAGYYIGYLGGIPVATAARMSYARMAGIFNVSTVDGYRRRGIAEAMTRHAALEGTPDGCIASSLQATRMGFPLYQRMGYIPAANYTVWYAR